MEYWMNSYKNTGWHKLPGCKEGQPTESIEFFISVGDQPSPDFGGDRNPEEEGIPAMPI